jgi:translation elongation factor EF-Tu-like GTPase
MNRTPPHDAEARLTFLRTEDGGKQHSVTSDYRPQFHYDGRDWDARHFYPDVERVNPGDTVRVILSFLSPAQHIGKLAVGSPFVIREGQKIVGYGAITKLIELETSAERY